MSEPLRIVAGEWYIGVICKKCGKPIYVFHDKSSGKGSLNGPGRLDVTCSHCTHQDLYGTDETQNLKAQ